MITDTINLLSHNVPENPDVADLHQATLNLASKGGIVVPWSGGLDSTTAAMWAIETGLEVTLLSVTADQPWDAGERRARSFIKEQIRELQRCRHVEVVFHDHFEQYAHIQAGRNFAIGAEAMELLSHRYGWGEVWMAWTDGEIPRATGDKSHAALAHLQSEYAGPYIFTVPTAHHTKGALVAWWAARGRIADVSILYSCFVGETVPCGRCQACWRFWAAFAANGLHHSLSWNHRINFEEHIAKYKGKGYLSKEREREDKFAIATYERQR